MHFEPPVLFYWQDSEKHYRRVLSKYRTRLLSAAQVTYYLVYFMYIILYSVLKLNLTNGSIFENGSIYVVRHSSGLLLQGYMDEDARVALLQIAKMREEYVC